MCILYLITLKIYDIPLDIEKQLFFAFLNQYDKVTSSKFYVYGLYYQCIVTFANANIIKKVQLVLNYGKHSFRVYLRNLTKEEFKLKRKFDLKLLNMLSGTTAFDLQDILKEVNSLTYFISQRQNTNTYQKKRYAYIQFKSNKECIQAKFKAFQLKNRLLYFVDASTKTCCLCGSYLHMVRSCKEAQKTNAQIEQNNLLPESIIVSMPNLLSQETIRSFMEMKMIIIGTVPNCAIYVIFQAHKNLIGQGSDWCIKKEFLFRKLNLPRIITIIRNNNKVGFYSEQTNKTQKGDTKLLPQFNFTTSKQHNKITNNEKILIYGHMEKLENMF